jgi:hypothetical protein
MEDLVRLQFFPGSELSPPFLLGGIVDLDKPSHVIANLVIDDERQVQVKAVLPLNDDQMEKVREFSATIPLENLSRVAVGDIMFYTSRRKAMC